MFILPVFAVIVIAIIFVIYSITKDSKAEPDNTSSVEAPSAPAAVASDSNGAEHALKIVANITLVLGIFASIVLFVALCEARDPYTGSNEFSLSGVAISLGTLLSTLASWAVMKVLANISLTLKDIKNQNNK